jgi:hypothetical protein
LDWEEEIKLIQEIIFNNFSVSSFVSSKAPHLPSRLCLDHGQLQVINELSHPTDNLAGEGSGNETVFLIPSARSYLAKRISGDSKEAIVP